MFFVLAWESDALRKPRASAWYIATSTLRFPRTANGSPRSRATPPRAAEHRRCGISSSGTYPAVRPSSSRCPAGACRNVGPTRRRGVRTASTSALPCAPRAVTRAPCTRWMPTAAAWPSCWISAAPSCACATCRMAGSPCWRFKTPPRKSARLRPARRSPAIWMQPPPEQRIAVLDTGCFALGLAPRSVCLRI